VSRPTVTGTEHFAHDDLLGLLCTRDDRRLEKEFVATAQLVAGCDLDVLEFGPSTSTKPAPAFFSCSNTSMDWKDV